MIRGTQTEGLPIGGDNPVNLRLGLLVLLIVDGAGQTQAVAYILAQR